MEYLDIRAYCAQKPGAEESFPFDETTLVFKVGGKMFALMDAIDAASINLKANPELSAELREQYDGVRPGYHMNKKHWNTVSLDGSVPASVVLRLIDHSYDLVRSALPAKVRAALP
jgi:predicted DNA-binding protein (MmcQ/YjbR family)